jgi:hypothetical protein
VMSFVRTPREHTERHSLRLEVDDPVAIVPNQLRLHAENGLGKKERQLWIGDGGPLTSAKRLPKLPDLIAQRLRFESCGGRSARVPRRPRDVCKRCASRASRQLNGRPKPAWTDRAGREGHNSRRPSSQG